MDRTTATTSQHAPSVGGIKTTVKGKARQAVPLASADRPAMPARKRHAGAQSLGGNMSAVYASAVCQRPYGADRPGSRQVNHNLFAGNRKRTQPSQTALGCIGPVAWWLCASGRIFRPAGGLRRWQYRPSGRNTLRYRCNTIIRTNRNGPHNLTQRCKSHECCNSRTPDTRMGRPSPRWQNQDFHPRELPILVKCGVDFLQAVEASAVGPGTSLRCFRPVFGGAKVRRPERPCAAL